MKPARNILISIGMLVIVGCSSPALEDHGQTRFEQQEAGFKDRSDREREQVGQARETQKFGG
ncbi:MAG: hypothetical protein SynsKO_10980 [Synoicihabitans sp.]